MAAVFASDGNFGRIFAVYGGIFVAGAMRRHRPNRFDVIGTLVCLAGLAVIM
ncbi:YnfA family protein [Streptomyces cinereoruber]|uniref:hypothetical protein n=1 Tax=Streptomyces cinereoruber TaxID=67260 RepID=UPI00362788AE